MIRLLILFKLQEPWWKSRKRRPRRPRRRPPILFERCLTIRGTTPLSKAFRAQQQKCTFSLYRMHKFCVASFISKLLRKPVLKLRIHKIMVGTSIYNCCDIKLLLATLPVITFLKESVWCWLGWNSNIARIVIVTMAVQNRWTAQRCCSNFMSLFAFQCYAWCSVIWVIIFKWIFCMTQQYTLSAYILELSARTEAVAAAASAGSATELGSDLWFSNMTSNSASSGSLSTSFFSLITVLVLRSIIFWIGLFIKIIG